MTAEDKQHDAVSFTTDLPPDLEPLAKYAFCELLRARGIRVVDRANVRSVHYGEKPTGTDVYLRRSSGLWAFFAERPGPRPPFQWVVMAGREVPVPMHDGGDVDLIGSAFYWLSGWDEYARRDRDEHGRVTFERSVQETLTDRPYPFVDPLRVELIAELARQGVAGSTISNGWRFCVSHDIDYVRKWTPGIALRVVKRYLRDRAFRDRFAFQVNPYRDSVHRMIEMVQQAGGRSTYFFKAGGGSRRDVRYSLDRGIGQELLRAVRAAGMEIGLHPAYESFLDTERLRMERRRLSLAAETDVDASRQHYLRTALPESAICLVEAGICIDATLGFPDAAGFRNATTYPYRIFDVHRRRVLPLLTVPLAFMDAGLFNRQNLGVDEAADVAAWTMEEARRYGGIATGLWHNVLWDEGEYPCWGDHFTRSLSAAKRLGGELVTISQAVSAYSPASESVCATPA